MLPLGLEKLAFHVQSSFMVFHTLAQASMSLEGFRLLYADFSRAFSILWCWRDERLTSEGNAFFLRILPITNEDRRRLRIATTSSAIIDEQAYFLSWDVTAWFCLKLRETLVDFCPKGQSSKAPHACPLLKSRTIVGSVKTFSKGIALAKTAMSARR
jgi:hypothetical protein